MNKMFAIILSIVLSLPITAWAVDNTVIDTETPITINTLDEDIEATESSKAQDITSETQYKQPISKRKIAKKFLAAMGGVAISSFAIFFFLTVYNRIRENCTKQVNTLEGEISLETPEDLDNAIKTFLDKTRW